MWGRFGVGLGLFEGKVVYGGRGDWEVGRGEVGGVGCGGCIGGKGKGGCSGCWLGGLVGRWLCLESEGRGYLGLCGG